MKKTITILMIAAVAAAAFASCGQVSEPDAADTSSAADTVSEAETEAPEEDSLPESLKPEETAAPEVESQPEESDESKSESGPETDPPDRTEPNMSYHDWLLQSISSDPIVDDYTFRDLVYNMGLANAYDEGKAYAMIPDSGGAGHSYFNVYYTDDYGESWTQDGFYDEINGENKRFALEDGGVMLFSLNSPREETYPVVTYLYFDGEGIKSAELKEYLAQTVLSDGRLLSEADNIDYDVTYRCEFIFDITITDRESGEVLCSEEFDMQWAKAYALENE